jgi:hypothetical protein
MRRLLFIIIVLLPSVLFAQTNEQPDIWKPLEFFIGSWEGTGEGLSGTSKVEANFRLVLNEKFLEARYRAVFEPSDKNPQGEVHEDFGFFSYDTFRKKFVYRQFNIEGFINQFVLDSISPNGKTIIFITENVENAPAGLRARATYKILNNDEFEEIFELEFLGKDFELCVKNHLKRIE